MKQLSPEVTIKIKKVSSHFYYFAYGANMNHRAMKKRCPGAIFLSKALLEDYRFLYDGNRGGIYANVVSKKGEQVWGGLFSLDQADLAALDAYEVYPVEYQRKFVKVQGANEKYCRAIIYYRRNQPAGVPTKSYRRLVVWGAKDCGLSFAYIQKYL